MIEILSNFWTQLGTVGQVELYAAVMSLLSVLVAKIPGPIGSVLKKIVDVLSANIAHKAEPPK